MSPISKLACLFLTFVLPVFLASGATAGSANNPPTADAGPDQTVDCESTGGALVTLDGTGSSDPDLDPLSYTWTNAFGVAFGATPTVSIPAGTDTVTLLVNDGRGGSDTDTTLVTVTDLTAPEVAAAITPVRSRGGGFIVSFGCSDLCDASPTATGTVGGDPVSSGQILSPREMAGHPLEVTCTDASGNSASRSVRRRSGGPFCGLGFELALLLPLVAGVRRCARGRHHMKTSALLAAALLAPAGLSAPAGAATLSLTGGTLGIQIGALPPITVAQSPDPFPISVSSGGGFTEPAGLFSGTIALPTALFTGVPLIQGLTLTVANGTKQIAPSQPPGPRTRRLIRPGGGLGGPGPLGGNVFVNILGLFNLVVPLDIVGSTGAATAVTAGTIRVAVNGTAWTTGPVQITQVTTVTPSGFFPTNTVTITGSDGRTPGHNGTMMVVSPFHVITNVAGNLPGFAFQTLTFAPAPAEMLLALAGGAAMAGYGWRRRQRRK